MGNPFDKDEFDDVLVECPECHQKTIAKDWPEGDGVSVSCDDCGEHPGTECPRCEERFDLVYYDACVRCGRLQDAYDVRYDHNAVCLGCEACEACEEASDE